MSVVVEKTWKNIAIRELTRLARINNFEIAEKMPGLRSQLICEVQVCIVLLQSFCSGNIHLLPDLEFWM